MKLLIISFAIIFSTGLSAAELRINLTKATESILPSFILECQEVAKNKIEALAKAADVEVDMTTFKLDTIDEGVIADYAWWEVDVTDPNGRTDIFPNLDYPKLNVMTQKPLTSECF